MLSDCIGKISFWAGHTLSQTSFCPLLISTPFLSFRSRFLGFVAPQASRSSGGVRLFICKLFGRVRAGIEKQGVFGGARFLFVAHAHIIWLNLYRVEFQNKFYKADGYQYEPFSFVNALKESSKEEG